MGRNGSNCIKGILVSAALNFRRSRDGCEEFASPGKLPFTISLLSPAADAIAVLEVNRERARRGRYRVRSEAGDRQRQNKSLTSGRVVSTDDGDIDICLLSFGYRAISVAPGRTSLSKIVILNRNALLRGGKQFML